MSVEAPGTGFAPHEDPLRHSGAMAPEAWTPYAPVGMGEHAYSQNASEAHAPAPPQNFGRDYDPTRAHLQIRPGEVSPVAFTPSSETSPTDPTPTPAEVSTSLSNDAKQNLYGLATSSKSEDVQTFAGLAGHLTPGERADYEAFRSAKDAEVIAAKRAEVEAQHAEAVARAAQPAMPEVQPEADPEAPILLLHSLKLRDPNAFKQEFAKLSGAEKGRFDAFEAREDARIKANVPGAAPMIPKLSADGERFITPPAPEVAPMPQNTEAAAQRHGSAADFRPVAPGETHRLFDDAYTKTPHPKTGIAKIGQVIKGLPRRLAGRSTVRRSK